MDKAGSTPRREAWHRIRSVLLAPPIVVLIFVTLLVEIGIFVGISILLGRTGLRTDGELMAFIFGFLMAGFLGVMWYLAVTLSGAGDWLTGARAERWTAKELTSLGQGWYHFSNLPFLEGFGADQWEVDIDHVVVGPYGVLVVESKYCSTHLDLGATRLEKRLREAVRQVDENAGRVRALLHRDAPEVPIRPVVVFWGRQVTPPGDVIRKVNDVRVVHGADSSEWLGRLQEVQLVSAARAKEVAAKIARYETVRTIARSSAPSQ